MLSAVGLHPLSPPLESATRDNPLNSAFPPPASPSSRPLTPLFDERAPPPPRPKLSPQETQRPLFPESPPRDPSIFSRHDGQGQEEEKEESFSPKLVRRASSGVVASVMSRSRSRSSAGRLLNATRAADGETRPVPASLTLPAAPHALPTSFLEELPFEQLIALVLALSRDRDADRLELARVGRECDALETMARGKGASEGELNRARVRARVDEGVQAGEGARKEWRIALREEQEAVVDPAEEAVPTKTETELDLADLADAIGENAFDFSGNSQSSQVGDDDDVGDGDDEVDLNRTVSRHSHLQDDAASVHSRLSAAGALPPFSADTPTASRTTSSPTNLTPRAPSTTHRPRQASLSSRLFGQFAPPPAKEPAPPLPPSSPTPASTVSLIAGLGLTGTKKAPSIRSVASVASVRSAAGSGGGGGQMGESWLGGWGKGWTKGHGRKGSNAVEDGTRSVAESEGEGGAIEDRALDGGQDTPVVEDSPGGRRRRQSTATGASAASSSTNRTAGTQPGPSWTSSPATTHLPDEADNNSSPASPIGSTLGFSPPRSQSTATPESSKQPTTPAKTHTNETPTSSGRQQIESPTILRPRGPSMPSLSASQALGEAARPGVSDSPTRSLSRQSSRASGIASLASHDLAGHLSASGTASCAHSAVADEEHDERAVGAVDAAGGAEDGEGQSTIKARAGGRTLSPSGDAGGGVNKLFIQPATPLYSAPPSTATMETQNKDKGYATSAQATLHRALGLGASASASLNGGVRSSSIRFPRSVSANSASSEPAVTLFPIPKLPSLSKYSPFAEPALARPVTAFELATPKSPVLETAKPIGPPLPVAPGNAPLTMELGTLATEEEVGMGVEDEDQAPLTDQFGFVFSKKDGLAVLKEKRARAAAAACAKGDAASTASQEVVDFAILDNEALDEAYQDELDQAEVAALHEALAIPAATHPTKSTRSTRPARSPSLASSTNPLPPSRPSSTRQTMKRLLEQRKAIDLAADRALQKEWDRFLLKRQEAKARLKARAVAEARHGGGAGQGSKAKEGLAALLGGKAGEGEGELVEAGWGGGELVGVAEMGLDDKAQWNEFKALIKKGIPMAYRAK